jgi:hypothetical protein
MGFREDANLTPVLPPDAKLTSSTIEYMHAAAVRYTCVTVPTLVLRDPRGNSLSARKSPGNFDLAIVFTMNRGRSLPFLAQNFHRKRMTSTVAAEEVCFVQGL